MSVYTQQSCIVTCCRCLTPFTMAGHLYQTRQQDHLNFYCPIGHGQYFAEGRSEEQKLRDRLAEEQMRVANLRDDLQCETLSHRATKGKVTKLKKRVANGVCPCCQRTFANLGRHMAGQHPEYADEASA